MRKILTSMALVAIGATANVQGQEIDLKPFAIMNTNQLLTGGKGITTTGITMTVTGNVVNIAPGPADSIQGFLAYAIDSSGGVLTTADSFAFFGPWSTMGTDGTVPFNRGFSLSGTDIDAGTTGASIFFLDNSWVATTDSIKTLLNVQYFEEHGIGNPFEDMLYRRSELVVGNTYGWYTHMRPYPNWEEGSFTDPDQTNNWSYTPVIWQGGVGIKELLSNTHYTALEVYPNPTVDQLNFKLEFAKANKSTVIRVLDIVGRALNSKAMGASASGTQQFSYNVAQLPAGTYSLQVITDHEIYISKFVKK